MQYAGTVNQDASPSRSERTVYSGCLLQTDFLLPETTSTWNPGPLPSWMQSSRSNRCRYLGMIDMGSPRLRAVFDSPKGTLLGLLAWTVLARWIGNIHALDTLSA